MWINKLTRSGLKPEMYSLLCVGDDLDWSTCEKFFIASARYLCCPITNSTEGGEFGIITDPQAKRRQSESMRRAAADPIVRERRAQSERAGHDVRIANIKAQLGTLENRLRAGEHSRNLWALPGMRNIKSAAAKAAWSDPVKAASRRANMSKGKRMGWARKKMENLRRLMEWDTA